MRAQSVIAGRVCIVKNDSWGFLAQSAGNTKAGRETGVPERTQEGLVREAVMRVVALCWREEYTGKEEKDWGRRPEAKQPGAHDGVGVTTDAPAGYFHSDGAQPGSQFPLGCNSREFALGGTDMIQKLDSVIREASLFLRGCPRSN